MCVPSMGSNASVFELYLLGGASSQSCARMMPRKGKWAVVSGSRPKSSIGCTHVHRLAVRRGSQLYTMCTRLHGASSESFFLLRSSSPSSQLLCVERLIERGGEEKIYRGTLALVASHHVPHNLQCLRRHPCLCTVGLRHRKSAQRRARGFRRLQTPHSRPECHRRRRHRSSPCCRRLQG
ncbi:hypothetical protein PENSPDRAFT_402879 [Peniophora sp. CONT]|nr:hypothetical protein PENSPDRAFT_402879 [Peniophora sp. CONT]